MSILVAAAALVSAQPDVPPPVVNRGPALVDFVWTRVACGGVEQVPTRAARPRVVASQIVVPDTLAPITLSFRISADGRPLGISEPAPDGGSRHVTYLPTGDLPATLAGWQFERGVERTGCTVTFTPRATPIAEAPRALIQRYAGLPRTPWTGWNEAMQRLRTLERGCTTPRAPQPLLRAFPDYETIPQPAGTVAHTVVGYDIDTRGRPIAVETIEGDGNVALDRAAIAAVAKSRYTSGARQGCSVPFYRTTGETLAAPDGPTAASVRPAGATCPTEVEWQRKPTLSYPEEFRLRRIEGWALIGFDVAPWGALGNVRVLASEPAAAFGERGRQIIQSATLRPSASGGTGCVERVVFRIRPVHGGEQPEAASSPGPE